METKEKRMRIFTSEEQIDKWQKETGHDIYKKCPIPKDRYAVFYLVKNEKEKRNK